MENVLYKVRDVTKARYSPKSKAIQIEFLVDWLPSEDGTRYKRSWEPWHLLGAATQRWSKVQKLKSELEMQKFVVQKALDYKLVSNGTEYEYLIKWAGYPESQATWEKPNILTAEQAAMFWGAPTIDSDEMRRGEWWICVRWETTGRHAHEMWYHSSDVETEYPELLEAWGVNEQDRRKAAVWEDGGTHEEECPPSRVYLELDATWTSVCEGYSTLMHHLYMECIKSDRTRAPKFLLRIPDVCFWRWVYYTKGDVWRKLVVKFVPDDEQQQTDGGVDVNDGDSAPAPQQMPMLAPGQGLSAHDLPTVPVQSNDPTVQQISAADLANMANAPGDVPRRRVYKQVYQVYWSDIESACKLMGGFNPHKCTAVKPSNSTISWKWYRVTIGDIKAEYDGSTLTFTQFPIECYQSKTTQSGRQVPDKQHPLLTTTRRRRLDPSAG